MSDKGVPPAIALPGYGTDGSSSSSPSSPSTPLDGVPGAIAAAVLEYQSRCADLERMGVPRDKADAAILEESRDLGGGARHDETINLTDWSRKVGIPRPVLEALVLVAYHARPPHATPRPPPVHAADPPREVPTSSAPGTPAPRATRAPKPPV